MHRQEQSDRGGGDPEERPGRAQQVPATGQNAKSRMDHAPGAADEEFERDLDETPEVQNAIRGSRVSAAADGSAPDHPARLERRRSARHRAKGQMPGRQHHRRRWYFVLLVTPHGSFDRTGGAFLSSSFHFQLVCVVQIAGDTESD